MRVSTYPISPLPIIQDGVDFHVGRGLWERVLVPA